MPVTYENVKEKRSLLLSMTGLTRLEFEKLLPMFEVALDEKTANDIESKEGRQRAYGGGRKSVLATVEDKLLFILVYMKTYPLQTMIGFMFGMGQSQANVWIHRLSGVVRTAMDEIDLLPERDPKKLEEVLAEDEEDEVAIDGAERKIQRPKDNEKQKKFYSGKKKTHTVKNNVIVGVNDRKVKYLSETFEGKKHDKKICDEENIGFPNGTILYKDTGFQGYEPDGVSTRQPKKKPKGGELSVEEKVENSMISGVRVVVEHVISGIKRCRIVKDVFRNTKGNFNDLVMEIACGLHNLRTEYR
jgi:hypothetical protein